MKIDYSTASVDEIRAELEMRPAPPPDAEMRAYVTSAPVDDYREPEMPMETVMEPVCDHMQQRDTRCPDETRTRGGNETATFFVLMFILFILVEGGKAAII